MMFILSLFFLIFFEHPKSLSKEERGQAFLEAILLSGKDTEIEKLYESEIN